MIRCLTTFKVSHELSTVRMAQFNIAGEPHILLITSQNRHLDPWPEAFGYIDYPLVMSVFDKSGNRIWERTFGRGTIPGMWFTPALAFDLDCDGVDEIYFVHNTDDTRPFSQLSTVLEKIDPRTGETLDSHHFPADNTMTEQMSHAFRFNLSAGYAHGKPVLVTEQGTYGDMYLQAYTTGMEPLWERVILKTDKGARASHSINVFDFNGDGVDELFYGERMISLADGQDVLCYDKDTFAGHSDIILPFFDDDGKYYLFTCRENDTQIGRSRVVTFDAEGNAVWRALFTTEKGPHNHVHSGWVANVKPNYRKIAAACNLAEVRTHATGSEFVFDACTGEPTEFPFPISLANLHPLDINGDGYHEFFNKGIIYDCEGQVIADMGSATTFVNAGKILGLPGEQIMVFARGSNAVELWGDDEAVDSPILQRRHANGFHELMLKQGTAGYNANPTVICAM